MALSQRIQKGNRRKLMNLVTLEGAAPDTTGDPGLPTGLLAESVPKEIEPDHLKDIKASKTTEAPDPWDSRKY
jgi:hypothetical protein